MAVACGSSASHRFPKRMRLDFPLMEYQVKKKCPNKNCIFYEHPETKTKNHMQPSSSSGGDRTAQLGIAGWAARQRTRHSLARRIWLCVSGQWSPWRWARSAAISLAKGSNLVVGVGRSSDVGRDNIVRHGRVGGACRAP
jgi:hypothetical protein